MSRRLTPHQVDLLMAVNQGSIAPVTLRLASELRWLEHLGLVDACDGVRYSLTEAGRRQVDQVESCRQDTAS